MSQQVLAGIVVLAVIYAPLLSLVIHMAKRLELKRELPSIIVFSIVVPCGWAYLIYWIFANLKDYRVSKLVGGVNADDAYTRDDPLNVARLLQQKAMSREAFDLLEEAMQRQPERADLVREQISICKFLSRSDKRAELEKRLAELEAKLAPR